MQDDNEQNCDAKFDTLLETILDAADRCIQKTSGRENKIKVPWWTGECELVNVSRGQDQMLIEHLIEDGEQLPGLSRTRAEQNPAGIRCLV